ncbi:cytochrome c oxidase subunit 3 [Gayadomonas joobiniege]|uniref:cytochrome c oxidase subunit 3 n=1 Tax=Gayadomonas joobiniege TaxID=1234606 RepID=UPI00036D2B2A|nr:cytochrome c oxidase subunit 3 [Gayadomonas joobiniege]
MSQQDKSQYYVPAQSPWPIVGACAFFLIAFGAGHMVADLQDPQASQWGSLLLIAGVLVLFIMLAGWFKDQINESRSGLHNRQLGISYRQGMLWFIFSEIMFFAAFFGALLYLRVIAVPWLGGDSNNAMTHAVLWPDFVPQWPLTETPDGTKTQAMGYWGLPLINTVILLTSSVTIHFADLGLKKGNRKQLSSMLFITILLGIGFLFLQVEEYIHAYQDLGLTLSSGVYGNTFFMLTGFHGLHVTLGTLFLLVMWLRIVRGHFSSENHFAFLAASWYWHFVDIVWLCLFLFVYVL